MKIKPLPSNKASLFIKLLDELKKILKVASPKNVLKSIIYGDNLLHIMKGLLMTL